MAGGGTARSSVPTRTADMGARVNIGIRPEDMVEATGEAAFEGQVEITEALGEVTLLYFRKQGEGNAVVAKLPGIHADLRNKTVRMTAAPSKVHVFHNGTSLLYR